MPIAVRTQTLTALQTPQVPMSGEVGMPGYADDQPDADALAHQHSHRDTYPHPGGDRHADAPSLSAAPSERAADRHQPRMADVEQLRARPPSP